MDIEKLKKKASSLCSDMSEEELIRFRACITREIINKAVSVDRDSYFFCPIECKVMKKKSGKKILERTMTRYHVSDKWFYLSRKGFNFIMKNK